MRALSLLLAATLVLAPASSFAEPTKQQCIEANVHAQDARRDHHFTEAAEALKLCLDPACPAAVRDDCAERLDALQKATPTIVFSAKDGDGHDLSEITVTIDGKPFLSKLDGSAVALDPGEHLFTFTSKSGEKLEKKIVVIEGEKGRHESVVIGNPKAPVSSPLPVAPQPEAPSSSRRTFGFVIAGAGLVGIGLGTYFGLHARSQWSESKDACSSGSCPDHAHALSTHDSAATSASLSTISFVTGGALLLGGVLLYVTSPSAEKPTPEKSTALRVVPSFTPQGGGLFATGRF